MLLVSCENFRQRSLRGWRLLACGLAASLCGVIRAAEPGLPSGLPADNLPKSLMASRPPAGVANLPAPPEDNPLTPASVQLGRKLFFDPLLSADRTVACASCHLPERGFAGTDGRAVGVSGRRGRRNAPSLINRAFGRSFFWDGREATLEAQALKPIEDPLEMDLPLDQLLDRLAKDADYAAQFRTAFPDGLTRANIGRALASFERTLVYGDSPVDRFVLAEEVGLLDDKARHGLWLFQSRARCWKCHTGQDLTDEKFHNTGVSVGREPLDLGRFEYTQDDADRGKFKTPSLRNVSETAPYMHDGSLNTLADVVEFYNQGGGKNERLDRAIEPLRLTAEESAALVAFLEKLVGRPAWE